MTIHLYDGAKQRRSELSLYSDSGERKYINADERMRFLKAAEQHDDLTHGLCMVLTYSGVRLSEALALSPNSLQPDAKVISVRSLKKRNKLVVREIPIPAMLIEQLGLLSGSPDTFWPWQRTWAWMRVKRVMAQAGIEGLQASPKGLRHGFGVNAVQSGVPLNLVQKWLGHAQLSTTAIYANALGPEEYAIAERMW